MSATLKNISLYVPFIFEHFDRDYVTDVFRPYGDIDVVELVPSRNRNGKNGHTVYVHFKRWYTTKEATAFHSELIKHGNTKLAHDARDPYEWLVLLKATSRVVPGERKKRISLDLEEVVKPETGLSDKPKEVVVDNKPKEVVVANKPKEVVVANKPKEVVDAPKAKTISYAQIAVKPTMLPTPLIKAKLNAKKVSPAPVSKPTPTPTPTPEEQEAMDAYLADQEQAEDEMEEMDQFLDEEDEHVIAIDGRYVHYLEQDNLALSEEVARLRAALLSVSNLMLAQSQEMMPVMPPPMESTTV